MRRRKKLGDELVSILTWPLSLSVDTKKGTTTLIISEEPNYNA
jgi:hypothetical protein